MCVIYTEYRTEPPRASKILVMRMPTFAPPTPTPRRHTGRAHSSQYINTTCRVSAGSAGCAPEKGEEGFASLPFLHACRCQRRSGGMDSVRAVCALLLWSFARAAATHADGRKNRPQKNKKIRRAYVEQAPSPGAEYASKALPLSQRFYR